MPRAHGDLRKIGAAQTPPTQWLYDLLHFLVGRWGLFGTSTTCDRYSLSSFLTLVTLFVYFNLQCVGSISSRWE